MATATGLMRMANNKHWLSDVLTGAGIGILSTELGYYLADLIFKERGINRLANEEVFSRMDKPSFLSPMPAPVKTSLSQCLLLAIRMSPVAVATLYAPMPRRRGFQPDGQTFIPEPVPRIKHPVERLRHRRTNGVQYVIR